MKRVRSHVNGLRSVIYLIPLEYIMYVYSKDAVVSIKKKKNK